MFRFICAILLAADAGGYYTSYSYSSGSGSSGCRNGKCSSSRSMSSPSMRSAVNNCGGNCCGGTAMGRSGNCMPSKMATSSYSISSATKPRFVSQMRPARQMISRSSISKPFSKPLSTWSSWSSWGSKSPVKTSSSSSSKTVQMKPGQTINVNVKCTRTGCSATTGSSNESPELGLCYETLLTTDEQCGRALSNAVTMEQCCATLGQAWGPNCVLCTQPAQKPAVAIVPAVVVKPQQRRRGGCPSAHTRVGSSCRRSSTLLTGPASGKQSNETGNCYRESRDKQLEKVDGSWTKLMCCCSIGAAWGTPDNACSADICSAKGPGYYNFEFKQFTSHGVRTEIKCQNNKCETKSTPLTKPLAKPATPVKSTSPSKSTSSSSASHVTFVKSIARGNCGKSAAAGRSSPCMRSCGGGGQSPCVVINNQRSQTISRCGSAIQKPCGSRRTPLRGDQGLGPGSLGAEKPEILETTAPPPPPRVITTRRPVRPCSKVSRCISRCGGCNNAKVITPPIKTMPQTTTTTTTTSTTTTTTTTTTTEAIELSDYSSSSSDYETDTDNSAESKCGDGACIESPEQAGGDDDQVNVPPPTDAHTAIQENPDAPTSGCGGLECDSPEAEAGIEIEAVVSLEVVPCISGHAGCSSSSGPAAEPPKQPAQSNRAAPDQDCLGHACVMPVIDVDDAAYDDAEQDEADFTNEDGCVGVDCGDVDDVQDYQPNRDAPEFGCNGAECGSPEAEQALEIELTAQGPCQGDSCNMDLVAKLSNEPSNQPNGQMPTEDCVGAEGCGNVEDAIIENSGIEVGCTGTGCVVVKVECDVASGAMCDPDQVMIENEPVVVVTDAPTTVVVTDAPTTQLPVVTDLPSSTDLPTAAALRAATEPVTAAADTASKSPDVVFNQSFGSYESSHTLSSSSDSSNSDSNTYDSNTYDSNTYDSSYDSSQGIDFVNQDPVNEPMDSDGLVELNQVTDCGPGYDQTVNGECVDIDECYSSNPCKNGHCFNTDGSYECNCRSGFEIRRDSMGSQRCEDINECVMNACGGVDSGATCVNKLGNYECICADFTHSFDETKKQCTPSESSYDSIDYGSNWYVAAEHGQCFSDVCAGDSIGMDTSYTDCCCGSGSQWLLDGEDKCSPCPSEFSLEWDQLCASYQDSSNQFKAQPAQVRREPRDLCHTEQFDRDGLTYEECCCSASVNPIWWGSTNTPCIGEYENGFYQQCPSGAGIASGTPLDECELFGDDNLCPNARCIDTAKRYQCTCDRNGYYWTGEQCENFNECSLPSVYCIGGQCVDTEGSYTCICPEGQIEGANGRCQSYSMAMAMVKPEVTVDFDEDNVCYSSNTCDMSQIQETSTSRTDCCCNGGGAWGSEDACTKCPTVSSRAYEEMCGLPAPAIVVKIDEPDVDFSQSDNSNSVAVDEYAVYEDSDSDSIYEIDDNYSSEYDLADQPNRQGQFKQFRLPNNNSRNHNGNDNRAVPLSARVIPEKLPSRGSFACGLPGGCGHGDCVKAPRGVTCQCHRGWRKNGQGRCNLH